MSVATEFVPTVYLSPPARRNDGCAGDEYVAPVVRLYAPSARSIAPPLRLTRRGAVVLAAAVALLAAGLVWIAWLSAPRAPAAPTRAPAVITVQSGDTLWSIATRVAPHHDPRAEVARLQRINNLSGAELAVGQVLRTR